MGKPFSDLEKRAYTILANGGDPLQSLDQELASFWQWRINPSANSHDLPAASERPNGRKLEDVAIRPFAVDLPTNTYAKVTISERSSTWGANDLQGLYQHVDITTTNIALRLKNFRPARVYARTGAANTPVSRTSRITGREYKSYYDRADQGYSAPFGDSADGDGLQARQVAIEQSLSSGDTTINLISFSPEKYRS